MRLWSIHPKYLDTKGLLALWREALLAKKVLEGRTKGYKHHPQLLRFKKQHDPVASINAYLQEIYNEARRRNYSFDTNKIGRRNKRKISVTSGQLLYEIKHLKEKLQKRMPEMYEQIKRLHFPESNPIFRVKKGGKEPWEN